MTPTDSATRRKAWTSLPQPIRWVLIGSGMVRICEETGCPIVTLPQTEILEMCESCGCRAATTVSIDGDHYCAECDREYTGLVAELEASVAAKRGTRAANAPVGGL